MSVNQSDTANSILRWRARARARAVSRPGGWLAKPVGSLFPPRVDESRPSAPTTTAVHTRVEEEGARVKLEFSSRALL